MIRMEAIGTKAVERTLREIAPREALNLTRSTVRAVATEIRKDARAGMNFTGGYSTGMMKRLTALDVHRVRGGIVQIDVVVGRKAFYWRFYEYGQGGNPRKAMFANAVGKMNGRLAARFEELFMKKLTARLVKVRAQNAARLRG